MKNCLDKEDIEGAVNATTKPQLTAQFGRLNLIDMFVFLRRVGVR